MGLVQAWLWGAPLPSAKGRADAVHVCMPGTVRGLGAYVVPDKRSQP